MHKLCSLLLKETGVRGGLALPRGPEPAASILSEPLNVSVADLFPTAQQTPAQPVAATLPHPDPLSQEGWGGARLCGLSCTLQRTLMMPELEKPI